MSLEILGCWAVFPRIVLSRCCGTCPPPSHGSSLGPLLTELPAPSVHHWLFLPFPALTTPVFPIPSQHVSILFLSLAFPSQARQDAGAHRTGGSTAGVWWQHKGRTCPTEQRRMHRAAWPRCEAVSVTQREHKQCPGRICWLMGYWACF